MPTTHSQQNSSRVERAMLLAALGFYGLALPLYVSVFRRGWASYDEESLIDQVQAWREGHGLVVRFAWGSLYRSLDIFLAAAAGPHLFLLHLPAFAAVLTETVLLYTWLRGHLGERAALWACLTDLVCTATFARGASLVAASLLPAAFLAGVLGCERLRRPWQAALWGLAAGLALLDYEGWFGALLFLLPYAFWLWRDKPGRIAAALAGLTLAGFSVWVLSPDLVSHVLARSEISDPDSGYLWQAWTNVQLLLSRGDRMAFSAAAYQPWPPRWTWLFIVLGSWEAWRRLPWLAWLLCCGGIALGLAGTHFEPHRLSLALLALGGCAGCGVALLWHRPWGRTLCLALLIFGLTDEIRAWVDVPQSKLDLVYGTSLNLEQAARWLAQNEPASGWDVITGLGPYNDGAFRFLLAQDGIPLRGANPVALVYWDYLPGLNLLRSRAKVIAFGTYHPVLLAFPEPEDAARLRQVSADLAVLHWTQISQSVGVMSDRCMAWLRAPRHGDPWARTVAWELWLFADLEKRNVDLTSVRTLLTEPLVCAWGPDVLAKELAKDHTSLAQRFREKANALDPSRRNLSIQERIARY